MATLRELKRRIGSVKSTQQLTKAMKMVAAAKLRRAQENMQRARPYSENINEVLGHVCAKVGPAVHPLLSVREPQNIAVVVIAGDRGLAGGFNANLIRRASTEIKQMQDTDSNVSVICVGKKSYEFFERRDYSILEKYINFFSDLEFSHAQEIARLIQDSYLNKKLDRIYLVYNEFKSVVQQIIVDKQILPIVPRLPENEKYQTDFLFEPTPTKILDKLGPRYLDIQLWQALLESYASELGARMAAMGAATENAQEVIEQLTLTYNKARQTAITTEMLEIVGGAEALKR